MTVSTMTRIGGARRLVLAAVLAAGLTGVALSVSNPQWFDGSTGVAGGVMMGPMPETGTQDGGDYVLDDVVQELAPPPVDDPRVYSQESRGTEFDGGTGDGSVWAVRPER
jgi:hypothetical protein